MADVSDKVLGFVLIAALVPLAITQFNDVDTTGWDATQIALWAVIGVVFLIAIVKMLMAKKGGDAA